MVIESTGKGTGSMAKRGVVERGMEGVSHILHIFGCVTLTALKQVVRQIETK